MLKAETSQSEDSVDRISAYYSLVFPNFTFYLQTTTCTIGRKTAQSTSSNDPQRVDVDLGPLKSVSRLHAKIEYDSDLERFVLAVLGRNGAWVDGVWASGGSRVALGEHSQIQIASRTFHFALPPPPPPEDTPSPSSGASRARSPSVDITSISPPSSLTSHSPPPVSVSNPVPHIPPEPPSSPQQSAKSKSPPTGGKSKSTIPTSPPSPPPPPTRPLTPEPTLPNSNAIGKGKSKKRKKSEADNAPPLPPKPDVMPPKPALTYAQLIYRAIKAIDGKATLQEIIAWIADTFDYYKWCDGAWMSSVRHNLSSGRAFKKMERCGGDRGKGFFWSIDERFESTFIEQEAKAKLESSGPSTAGKKLKDPKLLQPALKRSVHGDVNGTMPLPPPLMTTKPLERPGLPTIVKSEQATASLPSSSSMGPATMKVELSTIANGPTNSAIPYVRSAASITQQAATMAVKSPPTASVPIVPPAINATTAAAQAAVDQLAFSISTIPPSTRLPIVVGPPPSTYTPPTSSSTPNLPALSAAAPIPPMLLHNATIYLSPDIFGAHLTKEHIAGLEALGVHRALDILKGHVARWVKEKLGRRGKSGRGRGRGRGGAGGGDTGRKEVAGVVKKAVGPPMGVMNVSGVVQAVRPTVGEDEDVNVVDDSDDEGPMTKKRKVEGGLVVGG